MNAAVTRGLVEECWSRGGISPVGREPAMTGLERELELAADGRLETSLLNLVLGGLFVDVPSARRALANLDPCDYILSADVTRVDEAARFQIIWTPVTGVVNLMLDWGLPVLDITTGELAVWLEVEHPVARRALTLLDTFAGVEVTVLGESVGEARVVLDAERCPLTSACPGSAL